MSGAIFRHHRSALLDDCCSRQRPSRRASRPPCKTCCGTWRNRHGPRHRQTHVRDCRFDGACYLELLWKDLRIRVLYTEGDAGHQTPAVMSVADATRSDELIEAHGKYRGEAVSVQDSGSWIKVISSDGAETISAPSTPRGPVSSIRGRSLTFSISGGKPSLGHPLEYQVELNEQYFAVPAGDATWRLAHT